MKNPKSQEDMQTEDTEAVEDTGIAGEMVSEDEESVLGEEEKDNEEPGMMGGTNM